MDNDVTPRGPEFVLPSGPTSAAAPPPADQPTAVLWGDLISSGSPEPEVSAATADKASSRGGNLARGVGLMLGGLLVGTIAVTAVQAAVQDGPTTPTASTTVQSPTLRQGGQTGQGGPAGAGLGGEQRLSGTLTAVRAGSITVRTSAGTATYVVTGDTEILRNGQQVALSALQAGDAVFLHVYPSGSSMVAERVFAGATRDGSGSDDSGSDDSGTTTSGRST